jgi:hypothetical protein
MRKPRTPKAANAGSSSAIRERAALQSNANSSSRPVALQTHQPRVRSTYPGHSGYPRVALDLYCEPARAVDRMLDHVEFDGAILDPCQGTGTIVSRCRARGLQATGSDIQDFGCNVVRDVFSIEEQLENVVCNPPFILAERILWHLLPLTHGQIVLFLRLSFYETQCRDSLFEQHPPQRILVHRERISCPPGQLDGPRNEWGSIIQPTGSGGKMPYAWFVFRRGYTGLTSATERI